MFVCIEQRKIRVERVVKATAVKVGDYRIRQWQNPHRLPFTLSIITSFSPRSRDLLVR